MSFGSPWALLLFGLAPIFVLISRGQLVHFSRQRRWAAIGLRLLIFSLLVLGLADARWLSRSDSLSVIFLVDHSDSISSDARQRTLDFIQQTLQTMPANDTAGVIVFGENVVVEETPRTNLQLDAIRSTPATGYTNIADAIRLAMAIFPTDASKRLVLLSDGRNNLGDARAAAQLAAANGIELSTIPLGSDEADGPEVRLDRLKVPNSLRENEQFDLELEIFSTVSTQSDVQIYVDGQLLPIKQVNLQPGSNRFLFPLTAQGQGFSTYRVQLVPADDTLSQNNRLDGYSIIEGPQAVLVVAEDAADVVNLVPALEAAGLRIETVAPPQMPATPTGLSRYASVIVVNTPAFAFSPSQLDLLQVYVRDLGQGLVVIGGPQSYGAGGYYQTPLEETLPVEMTLKDTDRLPGLSMFMVIDKSGSMETGGSPNGGGVAKVELAKEAIYRAIDLLTPFDRIGVVAFDDAARWVVQPEPVVDINGIKNRVGTIQADGGTDILAGLQVAAEAVTSEPSRLRHIVLLTDGGADPTGIPELVDELVKQEISLSVVAIGQDYAPFLEEIAQQAGGRFHLAQDASTIPQIFAQEAALAQKAYIIEEPFSPRLTARSPILQGISALPDLYGYIGSTPKLTAQTVLVSHQEDPLLAQWQYGLGRAVAWTSDAKGQWARDWVSWADFARFWGQAVRWTIVEGTRGGLETQVTFNSQTGTYQLSVEALDQNGNYINNLDVTGSLVSPDLQQQDLGLTQVAPGLYQTDLRPDETGAYLLRILGTDETGQLSSSTTQGFVVSYSPEYVTDGTPQNLMADLADLGQGRVFSLADSGRIFAHNLPPAHGATALWPTLLTLFVLLLPLDVALRRIVVGREEIEQLVVRVRRFLPQMTPKTTAPKVTTSSASSLLSVKRKDPAESETPTQAPQVPSNPTRFTPPSERPPTTAEPSTPAPVEETPPNLDTAPSDDRMSRLLKAKRQARRQNDK